MNFTFIVWGIVAIVAGLLFDSFTSAGGSILRTVGLVLIMLGILLMLVDIAREPRYRTWRTRF